MTITLLDDAQTAAASALVWLRSTAHALLTGFGRHKEVYGLAVLTYLASLLQSHLLGVPLVFGTAAIISTTTLLLVLAIILFRLLTELLRLWRTGYPGSPTLALVRTLFQDILTPGRIANGAHALVATGLFAVGFSIIKSNIPQAIPFAWDEWLMRMDRALHFGLLPHELLMPLLKAPLATFTMNVIYNAWFLVLLTFFIWQGLREQDGPLRQRYLRAYLLSWGLGTLVLGTIFSSAGPCFYGRVVTGPDPYAGLMDHLAKASTHYPVWALSTQELLWQQYTAGKGAISGISAMPSMHVASSVLFLLCARTAGIRWLTWFCWSFAAAILVGSVLLAWHYAIDSYVGVLVALACWKIAGWWVEGRPLKTQPA